MSDAKSPTNAVRTQPPRIAIAIRAWNEEAAIRRTLESLFEQTLFEDLSRRGESCEVLCIPNGCTDRTSEIATLVFAEQARSHRFADAFVSLPSRSVPNVERLMRISAKH